MTIKSGERYVFVAQATDHEKRLDIFLVEQFPDYSRSFFKSLIDQGALTINGKLVAKAGVSLKEHDQIVLTVPVPAEKQILSSEDTQKLGVTIVYQEPDFAIINKPAGIVVHPPSHKSTDISLVDWVLSSFNNVEDVGYADRPGIVHRLDRETSGLMIIPLTAQAHATFSDMFKKREVHKTYLALVQGHPDKTGIIDFPIGRDPRVRNKMTHKGDGRPSETHYEVLEYFKDVTLVKAQPVTGRTHQIRVHFKAIGHPLLGDPLYGVLTPALIKRHALHAKELQFMYKGKEYHFELPLPEDMERALVRLK